MKKILCLLIIGISIFSLIGCSEKSEVNVAVEDIFSEIENEIDFKGLTEVNLKNEEMSKVNKQIVKGYKINLENVEEGIIKCPMINLAAEEIVIIKAKDKSKVALIKETLKDHVQKQLKAYENYVPKNYDLVKNHILKAEGKYIILVISEHGEKIEKIFDNTLSNN
ncbi:MAG: DUF4358 domain-containing protein [Firmicutes bacterium]|nr:DUF4358 domain-containing protein [Bacillota bacterium]